MMTLIIGGSASGKSEYAERLVCSLPGERIYLATMQQWDEECRQRIAKHRKARSARGFRTVECYRNLSEAEIPPGSNVLLEDLGNLTANEIYGIDSGGAEAVLGGIRDLARKCLHLTVVSNEVFSDGADYGDETVEYLKILAGIHRILARDADAVVEVCCGIPVYRKGEKLW